jgi:NIPSNAP
MSEPAKRPETAVPVIEIRTFRLVPGGKEAFDRVAHRVLPMLERYGIRVVACEPSADPDDHYLLIRAFTSAAERDEQLGAFYGSDEWHEKYRRSVLDLIESYHIVAIELTAPLAESLSELVLATSPKRVEESIVGGKTG